MKDIFPGQQERLQLVVKKATGYGVLIYLERDGDVAFLTPIAPELRGYEIVSACAEPEGRDYDIWRNGDLLKTRLTLQEVLDFLKPAAKSDVEYMKNVARWTEDTLRFYRVPEKAK